MASNNNQFLGVTRQTRPWGSRALAIGLAISLLAPLALPALGSSPSEGPDQAGQALDSSPREWPPHSWIEGDMASLSLGDLALLASDSPPTPKNRAQLEEGLSVLEDLPEDSTNVTRVILEGLALARWHQWQAMRHLSDDQRAIVASAHPDKPLPAGWDGVMATVDHGELAKALLALEAASMQALAIINAPPEQPDHAPGVAGVLSEATGAPLPSRLPILEDYGGGLDATVKLLALVTGTELLPEEILHVEKSLEQMPEGARAALHLILEGLVPFAWGAPADPGPDLVGLGAAVDVAEATLLLWSTAALAEQVHYVQTGPGIVIPDADAEKPPLHFGVPRLRAPDAPLPPALSLSDALGELALALGDEETARNTEDLSASVVEVLPRSQQEAISQMLAQGARYIRAHEALAAEPVPFFLEDDPDRLASWSVYLDEGLPEPGSLEAEELLQARSWLSARLETILAREDLMTAIQEAVGELSPQPQQQSGSSSGGNPVPDLMMPMSAPAEELGVECPVDGEILGVAPYFLIEPCGTDTHWDYDEHQTMFLIDVGGNDTYNGPFARAPFEVNVPFLEVVSPLAIHLDMGGSDFYNATGFDCALGAACGESDHGPADGIGAGTQEPPGGFGAWYEGGVPSIGVLVDWQNDGDHVENRFIAEDESLGYGRGHSIREGTVFNSIYRNPFGTGLLIERVGSEGNLTSFYEAGNYAQGASHNGTGIGLLLRLVGSGSESRADFVAGGHAQGAVDRVEPATSNFGVSDQLGIGALINVGGASSKSSNTYRAGEIVQGASDRANGGGVGLFADIMGPGGQSEDTYIAENNARGFGVGGYFFDLLLPDTVDQEGLVEVSPEPGAPENQIPDSDDPGFPGFPDEGTQNPGEASTFGARVNAESTGRGSSNDDVFRMTGQAPLRAHGFGDGSLYLNLGGNNTYEGYPGECGGDSFLPNLTGPANECIWHQSGEDDVGMAPTGIDTSALDDHDGDFFPYFLEELLGTSDDDPDDVYPTGRRVVFDFGSNYPFLNETHAFVLRLAGNSEYGTGFSSTVLLDLEGDNRHFGRTATATRPSINVDTGSTMPSASVNEREEIPSAAHNLLSFTLDLDGDDMYMSKVNGSQGFGSGGAVGILLDLGGNDQYNGTAFTQGVGLDAGIGVLVDLKNRIDRDNPFGQEPVEENRFRADGRPAQGHGAGRGIGFLIADGDYNSFEDGESDPPPPSSLMHQLRELLDNMDDVELPEEIEDALVQIGQAVPELQNARDEAEEGLEEIRETLGGFEQMVFDQLVDLLDEVWFGSGIADEASLPGGLHQSGEDGGAGGSFNMGENRAPEITGWRVRSPGGEIWEGGGSGGSGPSFLVAGIPYTFVVEVEDDDGDRMEVCWEFEKGGGDTDRICEFVEGQGKVEVDYTWTSVHTDARVPEVEKTITYSFGVVARDPGGLSDSRNMVSEVENSPLPIVGESLRGPQVRVGREVYAFQVPFGTDGRYDLVVAPDDDAVLVDWGDGNGGVFSATAVDWAASRWGSVAELQSGFPAVEDGDEMIQIILGQGNLRNMIDGNENTFAQFDQPDHEVIGVPISPATVVVTFEGSRQVRQVALNASLNPDSSPVRLSLDGIRADGSIQSFSQDDEGTPGIVRMGEEFNRTVWDLPEFPDLKGLVVRQLDSDPEESRSFRINEISAFGPGAIKTGGWSNPGLYAVDYTVLDRFGGRSGLMETVQVLGGEDDEIEPAIHLVDVGMRGDVRNASLAFRQEYPMDLRIEGLSQGDGFCVDWGAGDQDCQVAGQGGVPITGTRSFSKMWVEPGDYDVSIVSSDVPELNRILFTAHVEEAIDIQADGTGILFMTFEQDRTTWYEGTNYQAIVNAGGDNRYFGQVSASIPNPPIDNAMLPGVPVPNLLLDAGGDDLYITPASEGPLGSQVQPWDSDAGLPLNTFEAFGDNGPSIGWVDCGNSGSINDRSCIFLDTTGDLIVSEGDVVLNAIPGSDVPAGGVMAEDSVGINTEMIPGFFNPVFHDQGENGFYSEGDVVYLDNPGGDSEWVIQVSGDGFGSMEEGWPTNLESGIDFTFCYEDSDGIGQYTPGNPVYLVAGGSCSRVQPNDVRVFSGPEQGRTQGFAMHFGVALHLDAGGNDVYIAPGNAQAAATRGGVAALVSLNGHDRFNPLPADHPRVWEVSATFEKPTPMDVFRVDRPIGAGPNLVQGAAEDGMAILVTTGDPAFFHAGAKAQGYGAHQVPHVDHYVVPGAEAGCEDPVSAGIEAGPAIDADADHMRIFCLLGVGDVRDPTDPDNIMNWYNPLIVDSPSGFWCSTLFSPYSICNHAEPDTSVFGGFMTSGPRYGPGFGALVSFGGSTTYHAASDAQGSAGQDGRGLLLSHDGASTITAGARAQAFSESGLAVSMVGGVSVLRLGGQGQAVYEGDLLPDSEDTESNLEGPEAGLTRLGRGAALITSGADWGCSSEDTCGPGSPPAFGQNLPVGMDAPEIIVTPDIDGNGVFEAKNVIIHVDIDHAYGEKFQVTAHAIPFTSERDAEGGCVGAPITAPTIIHQEAGPTNLEIPIDLEEIIAGTDPLHPAGCTEIHVFARAVVEEDGVLVPMGGWGHGTDTALLLPPPRIPFSPESAVTHGQELEMWVRISEPLADVGQAEFRIVDDAGTAVDGSVNGFPKSGETVLVRWKPDDNMSDGSYRLQAKINDWPGPNSPWIDIQSIELDRLPPGDVDLDDRFVNPHPVGGDRQVRLSGTTEAVLDLEFRLVPEDGEEPEPIRPLPPSGCAADDDARDSISARLFGNPREEQRWSASFCLRGPLYVDDGDSFVLEHRRNGGDWIPLLNSPGESHRIIFTGEPPRVERIVTLDGFTGTTVAGNETQPVEMCVVLEHNGIGLDRHDTSVNVIARTPGGELKRFFIENLIESGGTGADDCHTEFSQDLEENQVVFGYQWYKQGRDEPLPEEWDYGVYVLARDRAGGLFDHNPGFRFPVDRTDPVISRAEFELPSMTLPDGSVVEQSGVRPGDLVDVRVWASDDNLNVVNTFVLPESGTLNFVVDELLGDHHTGSIQIPGDPEEVVGGTLRLDVEILDRAGNKADTEKWLRFENNSFGFDEGPFLEGRSESIDVQWTLDRALDGVGDGGRAVLRDASDSDDLDVQNAVAVGNDYRVTFPDLQSDTVYVVVLQLWDGAGWMLEWKEEVRTLAVPFGTELEMTTDFAPTYSGKIPLEGRFLAGSADISGVLRVHPDDPENPPSEIRIKDGSVDPLQPTSVPLQVSKGESSKFTVLWDSRERVPFCSVEDEECASAQEVKLYLVFTDGSLTWRENVTLRIDNTPPSLELDVSGPEANNGWYNGTIVVGASVDDATPPFSHSIEVLNMTAGALDAETFTLEEDGEYDLVITVADGAVPPNVAQLEATVRVDRSLPELNVTSGLESRWTNDGIVPVEVEADDRVSGLDGVRVRVGNLSWSAWSDPQFFNISMEVLDDGEHAIAVQARDFAGNVRQEELNVILDRTPPSLVDARWVGWSDEDETRPVLLVIAQDLLGEPGKPSGMDAVRFAVSPAGPWSDWKSMGNTGTFRIDNTEDGTIWLQLRDQVGNVADPVLVDRSLPERLDEGTGGDGMSDVPASALIRDLFFTPERGGPGTLFTFSATVFPFNGSLPDRVMLDIDGTLHEMEVEGPVMEGGARIYMTTLTISTSQFDSPHKLRVVALYNDWEVSSSERTGPMVAKFAEDGFFSQDGEDDQGFPVPAIPVLLLGVALLGVLAFKRRSTMLRNGGSLP